MDVIGREARELFSPTAKCCKGMSILFLIWAVATLLICGLVPTIIFIHLEQDSPYKVNSLPIVVPPAANNSINTTETNMSALILGK
jgi:hypothetical protein